MKEEEAATKKTEPTTKKTEAKEEGTTPKHIRVVYSDSTKSRCLIYSVSALVMLILIITCVSTFSYIAIQPRVPSFMLEDLYVDPLANSSVMVTLSSINPSHKTIVYYSDMSLYVQVPGDFETKRFFLESKRQEPRRVATWTAVVSNNNDNFIRTGEFLVRHGITDGEVIADTMIQWKSGISSPKFSLRVKCPVQLRLEDLSLAISKPMEDLSPAVSKPMEDLSPAISKPMSTCSHDLGF